MELPFAVESPITVSARADVRSETNDSLQNSESSSLVTASSQDSFVNSINHNLNISDHCGPFIPNNPRLLPPRHNSQSSRQIRQQQGQLVVIPAPEAQSAGNKDGVYGDPENDFTYVNVTEIDTDEDSPFLGEEELNRSQDQVRGDVLAVLIDEMKRGESRSILTDTESANKMALKAAGAKKQGDLISALDHHTQAAKSYKNIASAIRDKNPPLASSLLLLSQTQAKSAIALKGIVRLKPTELRQILPPSSRDAQERYSSAEISQKERLRAVVRGALSPRHPHEEDLTDSQFLGQAEISRKSSTIDNARNDHEGTLLTEEQIPSNSDNTNPVDEIMELERELRDMGMALELGNSMCSLDVRKQNRLKNSMVGDGSFMVVTPGSSSYMSSSIWGSNHCHNNSRPTTASLNNQQSSAGIRARANRVHNMRDASVAHTNRSLYQQTQIGTAQTVGNKNTCGLESSWWGNTNTTSQILNSSVMSLGVTQSGIEGGATTIDIPNSGNTKQIMRLMDSLKTLGDENAVLLREIEELEAARSEAKAARETMKRFKVEYGKRFSTLKNALEKFRQENASEKYVGNNPVNTSCFMKNATLLDQMQRQEQLIQKLTRDLKKEREESKKKDAALRKYESFYRDIKARSAQKAAQRQTQQQPQNSKQIRTVPSRSSTSR